MVGVNESNPTDRPAAHRPLLSLFAYIAIVMLCGAMLAPALHAFGQWVLSSTGGPDMAGKGTWGWLTSEIVKAPYSRYFTRSSQIFAVLLLWPLVKVGGIHRGLLPEWRPYRSGLGQWVLGLVLAAGLLLAMGWAFVSAGAYRLRPGADWWAVGPAISAALGAGILEELFFRGAVLGILLTTLRRWTAVFWCTFVFAAVHFLRAPDGWTLPEDQTGIFSGFAVLGAILKGFANADFLIAEFSTLFAVGWVLAWARLRTGRLWLSIGLHGGWVFGLKYFSAITSSSKAMRAGEWLPWIGQNLKIGLVPFVVVSLTGILVIALQSAISRPEGKISCQ